VYKPNTEFYRNPLKWFCWWWTETDDHHITLSYYRFRANTT